MDILAQRVYLKDLYMEQVLGANKNGEINPQTITLTEEEFWLNNEYALIEEIGMSKF